MIESALQGVDAQAPPKDRSGIVYAGTVLFCVDAGPRSRLGAPCAGRHGTGDAAPTRRRAVTGWSGRPSRGPGRASPAWRLREAGPSGGRRLGGHSGPPRPRSPRVRSAGEVRGACGGAPVASGLFCRAVARQNVSGMRPGRRLVPPPLFANPARLAGAAVPGLLGRLSRASAGRWPWWLRQPGQLPRPASAAARRVGSPPRRPFGLPWRADWMPPAPPRMGATITHARPVRLPCRPVWAACERWASPPPPPVPRPRWGRGRRKRLTARSGGDGGRTDRRPETERKSASPPVAPRPRREGTKRPFCSKTTVPKNDLPSEEILRSAVPDPRRRRLGQRR